VIKRCVDSVVGLVKDSIQKFVALEGVDRSLALAAQAFSALFPVLILVASVQPQSDRKDVARRLIERFGLTGEGADAVRNAFAAPETVKGSVTVISIFLVIFSALAFARALQRLYEKAWGLSSRGIKATAWGLGWLVIFSLYWVIITSIGEHDRTFVGLALGFGLWLVTPYVLLERRVRWRTLIPQALLTAVFITGVGLGSTIYMSRAVSSSAEQYGVVGVSFALLAWFVALAFAIVIAASIGTAIHERFFKRAE
jgi:membrane protein